ncbi:MAG TPA: phosphodiester glycosidase family protein [Acidimicrobiales bacterium]|nr:phosphodiester glycosidase family protein [Acidimicrobiales bacterium]
MKGDEPLAERPGSVALATGEPAPGTAIELWRPPGTIAPLPERTPAAPPRWRAGVGRVTSLARRHRFRSALVVLLLVMSPWEASYAAAVAGPGSGSLGARSTDWVRDHGGASLVGWVENLWYSHHSPPQGGRPPKGAIPVAAPTSTVAGPTPVDHLSRPAPIPALASPPLPGEGIWHPVGRPVSGLPATYEAFLRPDAVHTSLVAGVAWMDTRLLRATLYSGSYIPGGGPWAYSAPVGADASHYLVAAFNSGFRLKDSQGGYFSEGRMVAPLRNGAASLVIYRDGSVTVGQWGRDAVMGPDVSAVRQNLRLIVDGGHPAPGLTSPWAWGATLSNRVYVWRSAVGVTADGALVYVAGPGLDASSLANLLVRAGSVRAMELDINTDWVNFTSYRPDAPLGPALPSNGSLLLGQMSGGTGRYLMPWWNRDFIAMFARSSQVPPATRTS